MNLTSKELKKSLQRELFVLESSSFIAKIKGIWRKRFFSILRIGGRESIFFSMFYWKYDFFALNFAASSLDECLIQK